MNLKCFRGHTWEFLKLDKYFDVSWGVREPITLVFYKCNTCGKIKEKQSLPGHKWEPEDFIY